MRQSSTIRVLPLFLIRFSRGLERRQGSCRREAVTEASLDQHDFGTPPLRAVMERSAKGSCTTSRHNREESANINRHLATCLMSDIVLHINEKHCSEKGYRALLVVGACPDGDNVFC